MGRRLYIFYLIISIYLSGCATGPAPFKQFISPSQAVYEKADSYFQNKDYSAAIAAYEKFINGYPRSNLVPGAYLGIAWSYYLQGEYKQTLDNLVKVRTQDQGLKAWIDKLTQDAQKRMAQVISEQLARLFNLPQFTNKDKLTIEGAASADSKVTVNGQEAKRDNGIFRHEINLAEGENNITIVITDKDGKTEEKQTKVILDTTPVQIKVTSAELDDFGYVELKGTTKKGVQLTAENEVLTVDEQGNFTGRIRCPPNKQIKFMAEDRAGNTAEEIFADRDYPNRPAGLRLLALRGTSADIEWDENRETDLKGYNLYYTLQGEFSDAKNNRTVITDTRYTIDSLRQGKTYIVYIRAIDKLDNESDPSSEKLTIAVP